MHRYPAAPRSAANCPLRPDAHLCPHRLIIGLSAFAGGRIANATVFARSAKIVGAMSEPSVHYVVRVRADVVAIRWWSAVAGADDAPAVIRALLTGRSRVEVSADEALMIRAWAGAIDGW